MYKVISCYQFDKCKAFYTELIDKCNKEHNIPQLVPYVVRNKFLCTKSFYHKTLLLDGSLLFHKTSSIQKKKQGMSLKGNMQGSNIGLLWAKKGLIIVSK